jgi:hypothetical protein
MDLVGRDYHIAGSIPDNDDPYQILVRADRTPVRDYGADRWPCYR